MSGSFAPARTGCSINAEGIPGARPDRASKALNYGQTGSREFDLPAHGFFPMQYKREWAKHRLMNDGGVSVMATQSKDTSAAANLNEEHGDDLARRYPWLSGAEVREMLADAAEEYGAEEEAGLRRARPRT